MEKSEATLWREFRNGDRKAFERLLNLYYVSLFEYGSKFQPDDDKLRDALHNLMLSLWERRQFLNDTENLKLYLFKAVRNQIFREKAEPFAIRSITAEEEDQFTSDGNYAERTIIETELLHEKESKISAVMSRLSKRQQEVLHLKFYENLSNDQIAAMLDISRQAVANLLYQSLKAFRHYWQAGIVQLFLLIIIKINELILK